MLSLYQVSVLDPGHCNSNGNGNGSTALRSMCLSKSNSRQWSNWYFTRNRVKSVNTHRWWVCVCVEARNTMIYGECFFHKILSIQMRFFLCWCGFFPFSRSHLQIVGIVSNRKSFVFCLSWPLSVYFTVVMCKRISSRFSRPLALPFNSCLFLLAHMLIQRYQCMQEFVISFSLSSLSRTAMHHFAVIPSNGLKESYRPLHRHIAASCVQIFGYA